MREHVRSLAAPAAALLLVVGMGATTARSQDRGELATSIRFDSVTINSAAPGMKAIREVAPQLGDLRAWISAVGASVALADLNGDGTANEACVTDPRDDSVSVIPLPPRSRAATRLPEPPKIATPFAPMGCLPIDLDENGVEDLLVYYWGRSPVLFINEDDSGRTFTARELVSPSAVWNTNAVTAADLDGDGHLDLLLGNYFPDGARILDPQDDQDGRIQMQDSMSLARNGGTNRLLLTKPAARAEQPSLVDASWALPADSANSWTLAFGAQDLTDDGLPEVYVANDFGPDQLLVNLSSPGAPQFRNVVGTRNLTTPKSQILGHDSFKGMGVTFTHPEGNALSSIVVSNITTPFALQEANFFFDPAGHGQDLLNGISPYRQSAERRGLAHSGWSWDIKAVDFDNDGSEELLQATGFLAGSTNRWPELQELALSNDSLLRHAQSWFATRPGDDLSGHEPNRLWALGPSGIYHDVAGEAGAASTVVARGIAIGDVDRDGRPDAVVANQWANSVLMMNNTPAGASLCLELKMPATNGGLRDAVGARVTLRQSSAPTQYRQLFPSNGHAGVSAPELHFGLGPGTDDLELTVSWRDGAGQHTAKATTNPGRHTLVVSPDGQVRTS